MADIHGSDEQEELRRLLGSARCVLFDFDGPVCRLFAGQTSGEIAGRLREWMTAQGYEKELGQVADAFTDAYAVLRRLVALTVDPAVVSAVEKYLTQEELAATDSAWPTRHADALIQTLRATDRKIAIATNNAPEPVVQYLRTRKLTDAFGPHIHGRRHDARRLKPDPDCLERALASTGEPPAAAVMIGDSWVDLEAARALGVPFIGFATRPEKGTLLRERGATIVLDDLKPLLAAARTLRPLLRY
ncbi:HAD-IA family hydrolase [Streptomyces sp. NPDC051940]|uniref:HAD family hydrolase n=1 Tax=Streptomyces sp. NPDC051940 TaxID=3155675 RepID=UPI00342A993A